MLEAEVVYAARYEYCETVEDFIARRTRLAFLDTRACEEAIPKVCYVKLTCVHRILQPLLQSSCG